VTDQLLRARSLATHPLHTLRAAAALVADRPLFDAARKTWQRLWYEERPLADIPAFDDRSADASRNESDARQRLRIAGRARDAIVLRVPATRSWRTRSPAEGELRLWCAMMPGDWNLDATLRVTLRASGDRDERATIDLKPGTSWMHRRWTAMKLSVSGPTEVTLDVSSDGSEIDVAIGDASVRWRRPRTEVYALARAFLRRLRTAGLRDTVRWAERTSRQGEDQERYQAWVAKHTPDARALAAMARGLASWPGRPRFSILTPVYNTDPAWLEACIESVRAQVYPDWELILSDDASTREDTRVVLQSFEGDPRIRLVWNEQNRGIAGATQAALDRASGDFIALLDHDDALLPHALYRVAARLKAVGDADLIYSDEDKLELDGRRSDVYFSPIGRPTCFCRRCTSVTSS
jgi:hypothetical protein